MRTEYQIFKDKIDFAIEMHDMTLLVDQVSKLNTRVHKQEAPQHYFELLQWASLNLRTAFKPYPNVIYVDFKNKKKVS